MNKVIAKIKTQAREQSNIPFSQQFNFAESYTSLLLGIFVVFIASFLFVSFIKNKTSVTMPVVEPVKTEVISQELQKVKENKDAVYTVVAGDTLWSIAEKKYNSGFEWATIAQANNLTNPRIIEVGTKIALPQEKSKILATSTVSEQVIQQQSANSIQENTYTVKQGDDLWDIAVRAYGDGYKWPEIARANSIPNPDIIYTGTVLKIPRDSIVSG